MTFLSFVLKINKCKVEMNIYRLRIAGEHQVFFGSGYIDRIFSRHNIWHKNNISQQ